MTPDLIENLQAGDGLQAGNPAIGRATPLAYYSNEHYKAYPHAEHYSNDKDDPWFVRGYALWKIGMWAIGAYGDSDFGLGPRVDA